MVVLTCWGLFGWRDEYPDHLQKPWIEYPTLNVKDHWAPWWPPAGLAWPEKDIEVIA